jgi:aminopeptidase YwaD
MKRTKLGFINLIFFLLLWISCAVTQTVPKTDDEAKAIFKKDISTLASDKFMGRATGTEGEKLSSDYIVSWFKKLKLTPKGTDGFLQPFTFTAAAQTGTSTQFYINSKSYRLNDDFYPLSFSGNGITSGYIVKVGYGIVAPGLKYDDYAGKISLSKKIFVMETGTPDGNNPHGKYFDWSDLKKKVETAITKGAAAVIFINSDTTLDNPSEKINAKVATLKIPVIFATGEAMKVLKNDIVTNCTVGVEITREQKTGHNVIAMLDNKAATTIVIGAHYDHLGMGEVEGSLYRGPAAVHNGADDNASGTAMLMQLALYLKQPQFSKSNYVFIAFSGEELGLLGSNFFVKNPTIDLKTVSCMINMDMVGRLKTDEKTLIINGVGTSPRWKTVLDSVTVDGLKIKTSESGIGPSDHTSFYLQDIPSLHFFSGTHEDYHKPSDDENKINYEGMVSIQKIILNLIERIEGSGKLTFAKTNDSANEDAPRFKVTLGIIPDYAFDGEGVRADGISEGRPAEKAGMKKGDIIVQLGDYKTMDLMEYMKALGKFSKGKSTTVKVKRGNDMLELPVTF